MMFEFKTSIKMHHVDAAGVLFFARQFQLVHDAYEAFMESKGLSLSKILKTADFALPIVHAETDYKAPLFEGDRIVIKLKLKKIGETSFTLSHEIFKENGQLAGTGETVHVSIDKKTGAKIPLPPAARGLF
jgi:1,4-dihydroxy-2-naphthoyl-CoA hydrolase